MNTKVLPVMVLIGFVASALLANKLYGWKIGLTPHEAKVPTQFYAGMDKFLSNISWMTLIQWEADAAQNSFTAEEADKLAKRLNALTNLDPLFIDAYVDGALTIAPTRPNEALALLDKAISMNAGWKAPLCAGHICMNYTKDYAAAQRYLETAAQNPDAPFYARTALTSAKCEAVAHDPVKSIDIWYAEFNQSPAGDKDLRHAAAVRIVQYAAEIDGSGDSAGGTGPEAAPARKPTAEERARVTKIVDEVRSAIVHKESPTTAPTTNPTI